MNVFAMIPPGARLVLYLAYAIGSLVVTYLAAKGHVGAEEIAFWSGLGALFGFTASGNVDLHPDEYAPEHRLEVEG